MKNKPREIRIVHGDDDAKQALRQQYKDLLGDNVEVNIPQ
jgi:metallo-beta-lactamase family protein